MLDVRADPPDGNLTRRHRLGVIACAAGLLLTACKGATTAPTTSSGACASSAPGGVLGGDCNTRTPPLRVTGAGANSIQPFYTQVFYYYHQANAGVSVDYSPVGSSVGVTDIQQNTVQFGQSEIPIASPATGTAGTILQIPVDLGGVAISYNIPGIGTGLKLDGPTLAGIYTGTITNWDDAAIAALNGGTKLPHLGIVAVHRADSSGPGYDLDQYLIATGGTAWTSKAGTKAATRWPVASIGVGQQLNTGVASYVQQTQGAIGYVEYAFALKSKFNNVALKNASGAFVAPTLDAIAAGAQASNLSASNFNIVNGGGAAAYPLANFSWALLYQKQASNDLGIVLGKLFDWVTTTGQKQATPLGYAPMPANAVTLAHTTLLSLQTSSGQPLFS
ncbi:MAG TPA: phosphate ABC transporter substrate-binding protein PstS [Actinomycetota bacterium]|nr:phosphate ABC transporter substrate-binding protein PstS [Actinomycetota bacterium]